MPRRYPRDTFINDRHRTVARLVALGLTNGQIADRMEMTTKAIGNIVYQVCCLAGVKTANPRIGLAYWYLNDRSPSEREGIMKGEIK